MTEKERKAFDKLIERITRDAMMDLYKAALDQCDDIYTAMLIRLRENIDATLKERQKGEKPCLT